MKISIIGLGWFGEGLGEHFLKLGHEVHGTSRTLEKIQRLQDKGLKPALLNYPSTPEKALLDSDVIVLNIPPFPEQLTWFRSWDFNPETWVIFISSTSVLRGGSGVLKDEEDWIKEYFTKWTIIRFGGLIGNGRHPGKILSGKKNVPGRLWPVNLIHHDDCIGVVGSVIENRIQNSTFEAVSNEHPSKEQYYVRFCRENNLALPEFDQNDGTVREAIDNSAVRTFYDFKRRL